ncbi:MAG: hypothetical protein M3O95_10875, partial [Candidatus Dormibacteraeota bacterium]|nr:hypothetical protein [Candidatus Dormibacteraeota bacterium]
MVGEEEHRERAGATVESLAIQDRRDLEGDDRGDLLLIDLLNDFAELSALFGEVVRRGAWLDAYLLGCGMNQIVEDYLYADAYLLRRGTAYLATIPGPVGALAAGTVRGIDATYVRLRNLLPQIRQIARWQVELSTLIEHLARLVIHDGADAATVRRLRASSQLLSETLERLPVSILRSLIRLPS